MIFTERNPDPPSEVVRQEAERIWKSCLGFDIQNFYAYHWKFRKNYINVDACSAGYLALRGLDPCDFGLSNYCIFSYKHKETCAHYD